MPARLLIQALTILQHNTQRWAHFIPGTPDSQLYHLSVPICLLQCSATTSQNCFLPSSDPLQCITHAGYSACCRGSDTNQTGLQTQQSKQNRGFMTHNYSSGPRHQARAHAWRQFLTVTRAGWWPGMAALVISSAATTAAAPAAATSVAAVGAIGTTATVAALHNANACSVEPQSRS